MSKEQLKEYAIILIAVIVCFIVARNIPLLGVGLSMVFGTLYGAKK